MSENTKSDPVEKEAVVLPEAGTLVLSSSPHVQDGETVPVAGDGGGGLLFWSGCTAGDSALRVVLRGF